MGLFGDDKRQDERLDALEAHIRKLTETVQSIQADLAAGRIAVMEIQAQLDEKISAADVDPTFEALNAKLAEARKHMQQASEAGEESWKSLQTDASAAKRHRAGAPQPLRRRAHDGLAAGNFQIHV